jgi:spermidine/putrescine transport system substrate-binding protein
VYQPDVQAVITDYIGYVSPVPAAQEIILNEIDDPTVANSPLVFPTDEIAARAKAYYEFTTSDEENTWNETFQAVQQG